MSTIPNQARCLLALLLGVAVSSMPLHAAQTAETYSDRPSDYAFAAPISTTGPSGVVALKLPQSVYLKAESADLADLRVFDAKGIAQPFALQRPETQSETRRTRQSVAVFPIHANAETASALDLDIATRADGSVISVKTSTRGTTSSPSSRLAGLILDCGPLDDRARITALYFDRPTGRADYSAEVWLETSDDLKHWHAAGAAELAWLSNNDGQLLASDRLDLSTNRFRYARVTWHRGEPQIFPKVEVERASVATREPPRETLWLSAQAGKKEGDLTYTGAVALPVERIEFRLSEPNIVMPLAVGQYVERANVGNVGTAKTQEPRFEPILQTTVFQITQAQDGNVRGSGAIALQPTHRAEWVVRPLRPATARPEIGLSWQADTLIFLAGGTPPYQLAIGRSDARNATQPLTQVAPGFRVEELRQLPLAGVGEPIPVNPAAKQAIQTAAQRAGEAAQQRTLALWGALLLGVAILGAMTWKLVRDLQRKPDSTDKR